MWLTAEYVDEGAVAEAIVDLRGAGCDNGTIELFSAKPVELPRGLLDRRSRASLITVLAAILNGTLATAFMYYTQRDYQLEPAQAYLLRRASRRSRTPSGGQRDSFVRLVSLMVARRCAR